MVSESGTMSPQQPQGRPEAGSAPPADAAPAVRPPDPQLNAEGQQPEGPPPIRVVVDRAPGAPTVVETSTTAISLSWAAAVCTALGPAVEYIVNYELQMKQVDEKSARGPERWNVQYIGTASFVQVKGLQPGRTYAARVAAAPQLNVAGVEVEVPPSPMSASVLAHTLPCAPMGQPAPSLASRLKKELKFKWSEPEETGGRALQYVLQMSPAPEGWQDGADADGFVHVYHGTERAHLVKRLLPGVQYCARVKAINCEGESAWSPLAVCFTQATVPSWSLSDTPFVWDTSADSVSLGWPEPSCNGGAITEYEIEMDDGSGSGFRHVTRSSERQCAVRGLRSGILYKFRVRAENEAGRSMWSPLGEGRTAAVAPAACSAPTVLGTSQTSLSLRWEGPVDDGGSPVLYHQVEVLPRCAISRRAMADEWAVHYQGPDKACTISGLRAGCSYMARVAAVSQAGRGASSAVAILHTAPSMPGPPSAPVVTARQQTQLTVGWTPPEHDGGSPITAYRLEACCGGSTEGWRGHCGKGKGKVDPPFEVAYLGPNCNTVLTELEPGHRYWLRCSAINDQGSSGWGHTAHVETLPGLPLPVNVLQLAGASSTSLKLRWDQPFGQGAPVSGYVLEMGANLPPKQQEPAPLPQLPALQHADAQGGGSHAAAEQQQHAQEESQRNGHLDGTEPSLDHLRPAYQGPDCACTVSGLRPDTDYVLRVRAINAVGSSVSELKTFCTAPAPPSSPRSIEQLGETATGLHICWLPPAADHGAPVTGYQVECARSSSRRASAALAWKQAYQGTGLHAQVEGLSAGGSWLARVRASNACGWGPWSESLLCCTAPDVPGAPPGLAAKAVGTMVRASWEAAEDAGAVIQAYELEMATSDASNQFALVFRGDALWHRTQQLAANTAYLFRVRAVNKVGAGPYSPAAAVQTSKAPPPPPGEVLGQAQVADGGTSATSIEVSWVPAQQGPHEAACISYEVEAAGPATLRQTCAARCTTAVFAGLQPGAAYSFKVRCVGADGAGHGDWSSQAKVTLRALRSDEIAASRSAAAAAAAAVAIEPTAKVHKRRGEGRAAGQQPRAAAVVKTAAAKAPPRKGWQPAVSRFVKQCLYGANGTALLIALVPVCILFVALYYLSIG